MSDDDKWWLNWNFQYANEDVYGPLVGGHTIQEAFYTTLNKWLPAYLAEFNRNLGGEILLLPDAYRLRPEWETLPKDVRAQILVICNGTTGKPERFNHQTRSTWHVQVSIFLAGTQDWQETQALSFAYGAAVRAAIAQHPSLEGIAETTLWTGENYKEDGHSSTRIMGAFIIDFETTIANTLDVYGGPPNPLYAAEGVVTDPSVLPPDPAVYVEEAIVQVGIGITGPTGSPPNPEPGYTGSTGATGF